MTYPNGSALEVSLTPNKTAREELWAKASYDPTKIYDEDFDYHKGQMEFTLETAPPKKRTLRGGLGSTYFPRPNPPNSPVLIQNLAGPGRVVVPLNHGYSQKNSGIRLELERRYLAELMNVSKD